ncbi:Transcription factor ste11 [Hyphodiscus hymeniophilus]|uniref:Transcription factor ste11 n=1 Tax=Hyphodiscus hymeniophilus TaxID=353542 RepID=A0A9P6VL29_9HELO|nr:Transcription factor ste11 [Hyphodiscus hymeniophilus]
MAPQRPVVKKRTAIAAIANRDSHINNIIIKTPVWDFNIYSPEYHMQVYQDQYSTPATSPPTPSMQSQDMIRTRSGLGIPRSHHNLKPMPGGRPRVEKFPKMRKVKKEKIKAEKKVAKLEQPLSELTKDWTHVPVADIETYVNRSAEERRKEVDEGKIPGKVKRPMNSFMLYRKAYQNRTKDWCLQNNHQVVSQVCGDSWPLEPHEVKDQFSEWARIERINHQNAHPGYKFSPSKPGITKSTKRKMSEEPMSEESDLDDFDWQTGPSRSKRKHRQTPRQQSQQPVDYPTTRSAYQYSSRGNSIEPSRPSYHKSSYQASNPTRQAPQPYSQAHLEHGHYYQQSVQAGSQMGVEDVIIRKAAAPGVHSYLSSIPGGGGQDYDLMDPNAYGQYEVHQSHEHRIDPALMGPEHDEYNNGDFEDLHHPEGVYFGASHQGDQQWQGQYDLNDPSLHFLEMPPHRSEQQLPIQDPHMHVLRGNQEGWHVESLDEAPEFDKWMDGE